MKSSLKQKFTWANFETGEVIEVANPTTLNQALKMSQKGGYTSENGFIMYNNMEELIRDSKERGFTK